MLPESGVVGLGTGSTTRFFIEAVGRAVASGRSLRGVATSEVSRRQAESLGIEVLDDEGPWDIDVCVDGADEVSERLDLIKGGGGCHAREKIVNHAARQNVIIVDESKLSSRLGERWPVPIEVLGFGLRSTLRALGELGRVERRTTPAGLPWVTDSGNALVDLHYGPIENPGALQARLSTVPGVVDTGLFLGRADLVLVAGDSGVCRLLPPAGDRGARR